MVNRESCILDPDRDANPQHNVITNHLATPQPSKNSSKFVYIFFSNLAERQTDRQTDKRRG